MLQKNSPLWHRYKKNHAKIGRLQSSNYDITSTCNLRCEGCLFFSGDDYLQHTEVKELAQWDEFFKSEAKRGVNFAYIAGAEPSLVPERVTSAYKYIKQGVVYTNGTRKFSPEIGYRIHVSLWGDEATSEQYRGANLNAKALKNYADDKRAIMVMTINARNIGEIALVAKACARNNVRLTFSYFSATDEYLNNLDKQSEKNEFYRISSPNNNFLLTQQDFKDIEIELNKVIASYPNTILYSMDYNCWVTQKNSLHKLDNKGIAINCVNRLTPDYKHYGVDMKESKGKCCSPNIACSDCRAYAQASVNYLKRFSSIKGKHFEEWLGVWEIWGDLHMPILAN